MAQQQQTLAGIEAQIDGAGAVQAQAAAIGQGEGASFAAGGVQVGQPALGRVAAPAPPQGTAEQAKAGQGAQHFAARAVGFKQHPTCLGHMPRGALLKGAQRGARLAQALLQPIPGQLVRRILLQPVRQALQQRIVGRAGIERHHPVDGLLADRVKGARAHGCSSHR
ncbi:hypothetical protein D3C80_1462370 [compost metagenome]